MKTVIPNTRRYSDELNKDIIPVSMIDIRKIIVIDQGRSALGIVTKLPSGEYGVIDLYRCDNFWCNAVSTSIIEVIDMFNSSENHIYQFDERQEFIRWITKREHVALE